MRRLEARLRRTLSVVAATQLGISLLAAVSGAQQLTPPQVDLEDVVAIELVGRDLYAFDLLGTATPEVRLEIGETVRWKQARGRVGLVLTDRRALAASPSIGSWIEERFQLHEGLPDHAQIGTRVAMVVTNRRAMAFDATTGSWLVQSFGPQEQVVAAHVGASTAVVVTKRKAYGLSPDAGGFFSADIAIQEKLNSVSVQANAATIKTSKRVLVFRAPAGVWTSEDRKIN